jgi:hypothetical protein
MKAMLEISKSPIPVSKSGRLLYLSTTILIPIMLFVMAYDGSFGPDWQSGSMSDYTLIMLSGEASYYFYPLLIYSMLCMLLIIASPIRFARLFIVRLGIYTGAILAIQYATLFSLSMVEIEVYAIAALGVVIPYGARWLFRKMAQKYGKSMAWYLMLGLLGCLAVIAVIVTREMFAPFALLLLALASGPYWCVICVGLVSWRLLKSYELPLRNKRQQVFGGLAWVLPFLGAWRLSFLKTMEVYSSLPTYPPDCYIATAAAKGHTRLVMSQPVVIRNELEFRVNAQMKYFKCAELLLLAVQPKAHQKLRELYDFVGRRLSQAIVHPILADIIYLTLKPFEWLAKGLLVVVIPDIGKITPAIYSPDHVLRLTQVRADLLRSEDRRAKHNL